MKAIGILILLFVCFNVISQGTFEEGWEVGYKDAMADGNKAVFIVPIAPIVMANESDTYRSGYQRGYNKGLEKLGAESDVRIQRGAVIINSDDSEEGTFEEGWELGFKDAMADGNKSVFIVPIAPIVMANESDTYRSGYQRGYNKGLEKLGAESDVRVQRGTVIIDNGNVEEGTFDEGWKLGYSDAMDDGNKAVFIVPITPIVMANESNTYRSGYQRGYNKGVEDLND